MNRMKKIKNHSNLLWILGIYLVLGMSMLFLPEYTYRQKIVPFLWNSCILILLSTSLNLMIGYLGQLVIGHCGFMAVGAYSSALTTAALVRSGILCGDSFIQLLIRFMIGIVVGGLMAALLGILIGVPTLRLKDDYLAIITLGFGIIICNIINLIPFAGGKGLLEGTPSATLYAEGNGLGFSSREKVYMVAIILFNIKKVYYEKRLYIIYFR